MEINEVRLETLIKRCVKCLAHIKNIDNNPPLVQNYYSSFSQFQADNNKLIEFNRSKIKCQEDFEQARRILTDMLRPMLCSMLPENIWIKAGDFAITRNVNRVLIKLAWFIDEHGREKTNYLVSDYNYSKYAAFNGPVTWYINVSTVDPIMPFELTDEVLDIQSIIREDPYIVLIPETGCFYTVQGSKLLFAPMEIHGLIELDENKQPAWQEVGMMPEKYFCHVLPIIERLAGGMDNIQHFEIY